MRKIIVTLVALAFATTASAAVPTGPYKLDGKGKCHAANGQFVAKSYCATSAAVPPKHCKNPKTGKFVKCGTPGAIPA